MFIKMFFVLFIIVLTAFRANSLIYRSNFQPTDGPVVGGQNALIQSYPYQVSIEYYGHHFCAGAIVTEKYVITSAQCTRGPADYHSVRSGSAIAEKGGTVHQVKRIVLHEKFSNTTKGFPINDIAIVRVIEPFEFDEKRQPIKLFNLGEESKPGLDAVLTGWGETGEELADQLQTVTIPIVSRDVCNATYLSKGGLSKGTICAGPDACEGDLGGPLTINGRLAGVISWDHDCGKPNHPGVYTEIAALREWIDEHAELQNNISQR